VPIEIRGLNYLLLSEVATRAQVSRQTLWRWRQERKIPMGHKYRGRQVIYTPAEVRAIEDFAHRIDPIDPTPPEQPDLFDDL
jgi:predicted DNA-binding transcriptional regulator AlpA